VPSREISVADVVYAESPRNPRAAYAESVSDEADADNDQAAREHMEESPTQEVETENVVVHGRSQSASRVSRLTLTESIIELNAAVLGTPKAWAVEQMPGISIGELPLLSRIRSGLMLRLWQKGMPTKTSGTLCITLSTVSHSERKIAHNNPLTRSGSHRHHGHDIFPKATLPLTTRMEYRWHCNEA